MFSVVTVPLPAEEISVGLLHGTAGAATPSVWNGERAGHWAVISRKHARKRLAAVYSLDE